MSYSGTAIVTGATSVVEDGRAVALQLVKDGCSKLVLAGSNQAELSAVEDECRLVRPEGLEILTVVCKTSSQTNIDELITRVTDRFGDISYCANCERPEASRQCTLDIDPSNSRLPAMEWQRNTWLLMRAEIRQIVAQRRSGKRSPASIVNIAAAQGLASDGGFPGYCAAAHGIIGMTKSTAMDYLMDSICVNCVCPGASAPSSEVSQVKLKASNEGLLPPPNGRYITSDEVAQAVSFLLRDSSRSITGVSLPVDGGWSLKHY